MLSPAFNAASCSLRISSGHASTKVFTASTVSANMSSSPRTGIHAGKSIGLTISARAASTAALGPAGTRGSRSRQYASLPCRGTSTRMSFARERTGCMGADKAYRFWAGKTIPLNLALRAMATVATAGRAPANYGNLQHTALSAFWFGTNFLWIPLTTVLIQAQIDSVVPKGSQNTAIGVALG